MRGRDRSAERRVSAGVSAELPTEADSELNEADGKVFKQITDSWGEKAAHEPRHGHRGRSRDD